MQLHSADVATARDATAPTKSLVRLFVSYSRADEPAVIRLVEALERDGEVEVLRDKEDILPAEEWRARLESLILQADAFCSCLSPDSANSRECGWELDVAIKLNKRIVPVVLRDTPAENIPAAIAKLNFIFLRAIDPLDKGIERLQFVLQTDIGWIREHTRLGELAQRWDRDGRHATDLLRGHALEAAEKWLGTQPSEAPLPSGVQRDFIGTSRQGATRRQRWWIGISLLVAAVSIGLSILAFWQRNVAVEQRTAANARRLAAEALVGLNDVLASPVGATQNLLASLRLQPSQQARQALKIGMSRLEPLPVATLPWPTPDPGRLASMRFSPDGAWLAAAGEKALLIWDVKRGALRVEHALKPDESISKLVFGRDGRQVMVLTRPADGAQGMPRILMVELARASVTEHRFEHMLDAAEIGGRFLALVAGPAPAQVRAIEPASGATVWQVSLASPGQFGRLISASQLPDPEWRIPEPSLLDSPPANTNANANAIVLASDHGSVAVWSFDKPEPMHSFSLPEGAQVVSFGELGRVMAVRLAGGPLAVFDVFTGKEQWRSAPSSKHRPVRFIGGDRFVFTFDDGTVRLHSLAAGAAVQVEDARRSDYDLGGLANLERYSAIIDAQSTDDGALLATAWKDGRIDIWRPGLKSRYGAIDAMPRPNFESVARLDHGEILGATVTWTSPPPLFFSPTGRFVASQSMGLRTNTVGGVVADHPMVRIWDTRHGGEIARFRRQGGMLVAFSPRDDLMATLSQRQPAEQREQRLLELWSLAVPHTEVRRKHATYDLGFPARAGPDQATELQRDFTPPAGTAEGVWVGADRKLRMRDAQTGRAVVLDDLAPAAAVAFAEARAMVGKLRASVGAEHRSMIDQFMGGDPYAELAPQISGIPPQVPVHLYPLAISGDRRRAVVKLASTLRIYALDDKRHLRTIRIGDDLPMRGLGLNVPAEVVLSHNGSAIAASVLTLADATRIVTADWKGFGSRASQPFGDPGRWLEFTRQVEVFSAERNKRLARLEQKIEVLPIVTGPPISLASKPLAVSDDGHLLALEQQGADLGQGMPREFNSRIVVLDSSSGATRFETPPRPAPSPLVFGGFETLPKTAAFSPRAHHLVIDETKSACPPMLLTTPGGLQISVPSCPDMNTTLTLWDVGSGKLMRDVTFNTLQNWKWSIVPFGARDIASIALTDADIAIRSAVAINQRAQLEAISERVALDQDDRLMRLACARLQPDMRAFPEAAWTRALPGEAYQAICEGGTGRH